MDLWTRAKEIIPQGNQLLSKRSEIYPPYYARAKGVKIWDLEGNEYIDMASMGVGCCLLGYADNEVNNAIYYAIQKGSMSSLNCYEELELTELLLKLHPKMDMVRYARTGGEAMAIAVRIARTYTNKDKIAFCGYHGWHDWYLSANLEDKTNLDIHLLPDLECGGVPKCLEGTAIPFEFNKIEQLQEIVRKNDIGVIVVEPMRHEFPTDFFLHRIREIADLIGAVLIFDLITIGWRMETPSVSPDILVYAKAISNGYPMAAILGMKEVMESCKKTFISSTYWTERIGYVASLKTIEKLRECNVIKHINKIGRLIQHGWSLLAIKHNLDINIYPPNCLITFKFNYENAKELEDFFKREMLKRGYIAGLSVYVSYAHTEQIIEDYLEKVDEVFKLLK